MIFPTHTTRLAPGGVVPLGRKGYGLLGCASLTLIQVLVPADIASAAATVQPVMAEPMTPQISQLVPDLPRFPDERIPEPPLPDQPLPSLPSPEELLPSVEPQPPDGGLVPGLETLEETFFVADIQVVGSTVFSPADLDDWVAPYRGRQVSFGELLELRSAITERYVQAGYVTSGAIIPPQALVDNIVTLQVIEGTLADIVVTGLNRLNPAYVRSRIGLAAAPPLNLDRLLAGLQRLQLNPLIDQVAADLQAGVAPGTSILVVDVAEADSFTVDVGLDNQRSSSIGANQRAVGLREGNLSGWGDRILFAYTNTNGSNGVDLAYTLPVSPNNATVSLQGGYSSSRIIAPEFAVLEISGDSYYAELAYRHPLLETPTQDLALGLALSYQSNQTRLGLDNIGPFPLSPGADSQGITQVTALRFSQQWTQRSQSYVLAFRSQFSVGLDLFNATVNETGPDSRFLAWRGQGQWVQLLGPDTLLLLRGDAQLTTNDLLSQEEFGLGGASSVRGYRQDALLRDNGVQLSAELRLPIARVPNLEGTLQLIPFLDTGVAWNARGSSPGFSGSNTLVGTGLGLLWQQGNTLLARLDWGIPLIRISDDRQGLQESGLYYSIQYAFF